MHKEHEFLLKLETAGFDDELAQKVIGSKDNELAVKVVRFISNGGFEPTTNQKIARAGGHVAGKARAEIEKQTGESVITGMNARVLPVKKNKKTAQKKKKNL